MIKGIFVSLMAVIFSLSLAASASASVYLVEVENELVEGGINGGLFAGAQIGDTLTLRFWVESDTSNEVSENVAVYGPLIRTEMSINGVTSHTGAGRGQVEMMNNFWAVDNLWIGSSTNDGWGILMRLNINTTSWFVSTDITENEGAWNVDDLPLSSYHTTIRHGSFGSMRFVPKRVTILRDETMDCELDYNCSETIDDMDILDFYNDVQLHACCTAHPQYGPLIQTGAYHTIYCGEPIDLDFDGNGIVDLWDIVPTYYQYMDYKNQDADYYTNYPETHCVF